MKAYVFVITALVSIFLVSAAVPGALAEEGETAAEEQIDETDPSIAIGYVYVTVVEWTPDLEGIGAGLFTYSEFDFSEFFDKVVESLASLLGI